MPVLLLLGLPVLRLLRGLLILVFLLALPLLILIFVLILVLILVLVLRVLLRLTGLSVLIPAVPSVPTASFAPAPVYARLFYVFIFFHTVILT